MSLCDRLNINNLNNEEGVKFTSSDGKGKDGFVKKAGSGIFSGRSITVDIKNEKCKLNRGSLIDFLNSQINTSGKSKGDGGNLEKGFFFGLFGGSSDKDLNTALSNYLNSEKFQTNSDMKTNDVESVVEESTGKTKTQTNTITGSRIHSSTEQAEITSDGWGWVELTVNGEEIKSCPDLHSTRGDIVILPNKKDGTQIVKYWNWGWNPNSTMHHNPGVGVDDIKNLLLSQDGNDDPELIILTTGRGHQIGQEKKRDYGDKNSGVLKIQPEVQKFLEDKGIEVFIGKTAAAIDYYNTVRNSGKKIAALIHTTC